MNAQNGVIIRAWWTATSNSALRKPAQENLLENPASVPRISTENRLSAGSHNAESPGLSGALGVSASDCFR